MKLDFEFKLGIFNYQLAQLKHDKTRGWFIVYKVPNNHNGRLERKFIRLNYMMHRFEDEESFLKYAGNIVDTIYFRLRNGESPYLSDENARCYEPVRVMLDKFLEEKKRYVRPDTLRTYSSHVRVFRTWLEDHTKECLCIKFTPYLAVRYSEYVKSNRLRVNARTYNDNIKFLRSLFKWGQRHFYCKENPFRNVQLMNKEAKYREVVTMEQRQMIREYYEQRCPAFMVVIDLMFNSFVRPREITQKKLDLPDTLQLYSLRDSGIMALLDTELSPREVSEVIGHHDLQSINNYLHHHSDTLVEKTRRNTPRF